MNIKQAEFIVKGLVQGVGFRYFVKRKAQELGLNGYAKNRYNGDVEVVATGGESELQTLHELLKQGPSRSRVDKVSVYYSENPQNYSGFDIR